ncbi:hypothetical protein Tco_0856246 [Tanacetum coccineum]
MLRDGVVRWWPRLVEQLTRWCQTQHSVSSAGGLGWSNSSCNGARLHIGSRPISLGSFSGGGRGVGLAYVVEESGARLKVDGGPLVALCGGRWEVEEGGEPREVVCGGGDEEVT